MQDKDSTSPVTSDGKAGIDRHTFLFDTPLYDPIDIDRLDWGEDEETILDYMQGRVDAYSAKNHIDTTYTIESWKMDDYYSCGFGVFYKVKLTCVRKTDDVLYFFIAESGNSITKTGQYPSLADLSFGEIGKKYSGHMDRAYEEYLRNLLMKLTSSSR